MENICVHGVEMGPSKEGIVAGGVPNSVFRLSKELAELNIKSQLVTNDRKFREIGEKTTNFIFPYGDIHFTYVNSEYGGYKYSLEYFYKTFDKILEVNDLEGIDVIHGHSGLLDLAIVTGITSKAVDLPSIHTIYCPVRSKRGKNLLLKNQTKFLDQIIAISENIKKSLLEIGVPEEKITIIPPVIDFNKYKPGVAGNSLKKELGIVSDEPVLMYLGNLTEFKRIDTVLDSLYLVKKKFPNVKLLSGIELTHTGTTEREREIYNKINNYDLQDNIIELGLTSDIEKLMDISDIVVAPFSHTYKVADYPMTVLESMAVGTPVITSPVGGIKEIIKDGNDGLLINPYDERELAKQITDLLRNPEKAEKIGQNASDFMRNDFNQKKLAKKMKGLYKSFS